nr:Chain B, Protein BIM1 [Saccharomyces cerevisiae S288C]
SNNLIIDEETF